MQLWSAAMFLSGITEGIFGLEPLAHQHRLVLSPQLPKEWEFARLEGVEVGVYTIDIALDREEEGGYRVLIGHQGKMELDIELFLPSVGKPAWLTEEVAYTQELVGDLTRFSFVLEPEQRVQITTRGPR
jgi:cellobiose phosphorylase